LSAFDRAVKPTRAEEKTCCGPSGCGPVRLNIPQLN
jgi:hypothetical protein